MAATEFFVVLPYDIYPGFVQQVIQDVSLALFTTVSLSGRLLVHLSLDSRCCQPHSKFDILFPGGVATYEPIILQVCHTINSLLP